MIHKAKTNIILYPVEPEFLVNKVGLMDVPTKPGTGVEVNMKMLDKVTVKKKEFKL